MVCLGSGGGGGDGGSGCAAGMYLVPCYAAGCAVLSWFPVLCSAVVGGMFVQYVVCCSACALLLCAVKYCSLSCRYCVLLP